MKYYLSSYLVGGKGNQLKEWVGERRFGLIINSNDHLDEKKRKKKNDERYFLLKGWGLNVEILDLKDYFGYKEGLREILDEFGGVWVSGGDVFVLRQAMKLSGFDEVIKEMDREDFVYSGDSAGICVLAPNLEPYKIVDDPSLSPYEELDRTIWEGLNLFDDVILPHYKSDHYESRVVDEAVKYCEKNNFTYKTLEDGEVIIKG